MRGRSVACVVVLAGCGSGGQVADGQSADGQSADGGGTDAPLPIGRVSIQVLTLRGDGLPDPDGIAIFENPDGSVVHHGLVDAQGKAHADVQQYGSVTVVQVIHDQNGLRNDWVHISSIRGVQPGDQLVFGSRRRHDYVGAAGEVTMTPDLTTPTGTEFVRILTACGVSTPLTLYLSPTCIDSTFDALAIAYVDGTAYTLWEPDMPFVEGGTATFDGPWLEMGTATVTMSGVPPDHRLFAQLSTFLDSAPEAIDTQSFDTISPGTSVLSFDQPRDAGRGTLLYLSLSRADFRLGTSYYRRASTSPTDYVIDLAALPLPVLSGATSSLTGVSWSEIQAGEPDARLVGWSADTTATDDRRYFVISILEHPGAASSTLLPRLPVEYAEYDPATLAPSALGPTFGEVRYLDYDNIDGYDVARQYGPQVGYPQYSFLDVAHDVKMTWAY